MLVNDSSFQVRIMGFNFSFFGRQEHRVFNYRPRYYDPEKEELKQKFGNVDGSAKENYTPGSYISGSFRDGNYQRTREVGGAHHIISIVALVLVFLVIYLIAKYYPLIWQ